MVDWLGYIGRVTMLSIQSFCGSTQLRRSDTFGCLASWIFMFILLLLACHLSNIECNETEAVSPKWWIKKQRRDHVGCPYPLSSKHTPIEDLNRNEFK